MDSLRFKALFTEEVSTMKERMQTFESSPVNKFFYRFINEYLH